MERKFTDDEIVKALEICSKNNVIRHNELTYEGMPLRFLFEDTFDLIKRQKAYIEKVKPIHNSFERELEFAKQEAIKEFAERLRWYLASAFCYEDIYRNPQKETNRLIDNLVKEMTGEDHNGKPKQDS